MACGAIQNVTARQMDNFEKFWTILLEPNLYISCGRFEGDVTGQEIIRVTGLGSRVQVFRATVQVHIHYFPLFGRPSGRATGLTTTGLPPGLPTVATGLPPGLPTIATGLLGLPEEGK